MMPSSMSTMDAEDLANAKEDEKERLISGNNDDSEEDDDDFFLKGPSAKKSVRFATDKMKTVQAQISDVTEAMRDNVGRLLERGSQLEQLNARSDHLAATADTFRSSSTRLRRYAWWQETKGRLILICAVFVFVLIVFIPIILKYR